MNINKDNAMLIDIQYVKPDRKNKQPDYLYIIWKDLRDGSKHLEAVPEPMMEIYFEKPEFRNHSYNKNYARLEEVNKKVVKYKDIIYAIADDMGDVGKQRLQNCFDTRDYKGIKEFMIYPYVYGADYDIRAWYRYKWLQTFENELPKPISKGFLDIEVDSMEAVGFPSPSSCPIDLVTLIDWDTKTSYTFALIGVDSQDDPKQWTNLTLSKRRKREEKYNMYKHRIKEQEYWSSHIDELDYEAHKLFDENYPDMEYKFYFYKDERKMLVHLFQLINQLKKDFIQVWNIAFDMPYIIDRCRALGLDPAQVMCDKDFPVKECWFKHDNLNFEVKNKSHFMHLSSYTVFTDQMVNYAAIRKGQQELRSNKLTYIAQKEIGDEKLDYSEEGNIKTVSYRNYLMYFLYNIKDVLLQGGIEQATSDLETYYLTSYNNITPYESEFKQTVKLRNVQYLSFMSQNLVPGENVNGFLYNSRSEDDEDDEKEKFEGALVGDPLLINNFGEELYGRKTNSIFDYSVDFDMGAFYPSTIRVMNIDPSTLIFKMILDSSQYDSRGGDLAYHGITDTQMNPRSKDSFTGDIAKEVMDNFQTKNYLSFGYKWLNLPSINDVYEKLLKEEKHG